MDSKDIKQYLIEVDNILDTILVSGNGVFAIVKARKKLMELFESVDVKEMESNG